MKKINLPAGVLFDMDGVLADSEEFIARASCLMFAEKGLDVGLEDFRPFIGTGEDRFIGGVAEKYNFPLNIKTAKPRVYDIYLDIIKGQLQPLPGVHEFLNKCRSMSKKIALATSADMRKVKGNLAEIGLSLESFDAVVVGDDIQNKKPAPDLFLLAAKRLGLEAADCLVIEDSVSGVAAARAAGTRCLAITSTFTPEQLAGADYYAANLAEADTEVLNWQANNNSSPDISGHMTNLI